MLISTIKLRNNFLETVFKNYHLTIDSNVRLGPTNFGFKNKFFFERKTKNYISI